MSGVRFCKDCRWIERGWFGLTVAKTPYCLNPAAVDNQRIVDPVHGVDLTTRPFAKNARRPDGACGRDGKLFAPKVSGL